MEKKDAFKLIFVLIITGVIIFAEEIPAAAQSTAIPTQSAYLVESSIYSSLKGNQSINHEGNFSVSTVSDEHIADRFWIEANFSQQGQYFRLNISNANWQSFISNSKNYALRFLTFGSGNTYSIIIKDNAEKVIGFPAAGDGGILGGVSVKNQVAIASFDWLKSKAPAGFNWSNITEFGIRADKPGWMRISDIQLIQYNNDYRISMGVAGHDLQGSGWQQRLGNYQNYFGQKPSVGTYYSTIFEPIEETSDSSDHYSDIVNRARTISALNDIPAVTLEFRSWAQIAQKKGTDTNANQKIDAERIRFNQSNQSKISYDNLINNYVNQNRTLDAVNAGLLDPLLHNIANKIKELGPIYLRLFHEPYSWFPWGIRDSNDIQKFKEAWIHVGDIFNSEGATNVIFVMTLDPAEEGGNSWSEVTAIPEKYLSVVELDGYTDPILRRNAYLSSNELFSKKITEISWQLEAIYPDQSKRPSIAIGEFAFSGDPTAGISKENVYDWFINYDLSQRKWPITRFSILYTYKTGPRIDNELNYSPPQEGYWNAIWQPEYPWYANFLNNLRGILWQPPPTPTPTITPKPMPPQEIPTISPTVSPTPASTTNSPTETPVPEISSTCLLLSVVITTLIALLARRKKHNATSFN